MNGNELQHDNHTGVGEGLKFKWRDHLHRCRHLDLHQFYFPQASVVCKWNPLLPHVAKMVRKC